MCVSQKKAAWSGFSNHYVGQGSSSGCQAWWQVPQSELSHWLPRHCLNRCGYSIDNVQPSCLLIKKTKQVIRRKPTADTLCDGERLNDVVGTSQAIGQGESKDIWVDGKEKGKLFLFSGDMISHLENS